MQAAAPPFIHCWQADLGGDHPGWLAAAAALSAAERARQARLRLPSLRQTYGRAHGFLRAVLARYTARPASQLAFASGLHHKPILEPATLHFNLSYRASRAVLAVASHTPVGVDVELVNPLAAVEPLVASLFSPQEQAALQASTPNAWWPLFYLIWTRKEAYAKAQGLGLALPFTAFSVVQADSTGHLALVQPPGVQLSSFEAGPGYQLALATLAATPLPAQHFTFRIEDQ